jgi:hypothetical protein
MGAIETWFFEERLIEICRDKVDYKLEANKRWSRVISSQNFSLKNSIDTEL